MGRGAAGKKALDPHRPMPRGRVPPGERRYGGAARVERDRERERVGAREWGEGRRGSRGSR